MTVILCKRFYKPKSIPARATTVEVIAERLPKGAAHRYCIRSVIHSAGRCDIGRTERFGDEPAQVLEGLASVDREVSKLMVMSREVLIGGVDPDAQLFH